MAYGLYANAEDGSKPVGLSAWSKLSMGTFSVLLFILLYLRFYYRMGYTSSDKISQTSPTWSLLNLL